MDGFEKAIGFEPFATERGNDIGHCIFPENHKHGDMTGKFAIEREQRLWNCFGPLCGGGDLLSLAMLVTGLDVEAATEWLYQFTDQEIQTDVEFADELLAMLEDATERAKTMPYFNERVLDQFDGPTDYFQSRGISEDVIQAYGLRYSYTAMKMAPIKTGRTGTKIKTDDDYVGPASIWPHIWQGRLVGWQYRWTDYDKEHTKTPKWLPKWTNTTDFPKATTLYNYDYCLKAQRPVVVCESLGTVLFCRTHDIPAVAYFGSKPTPEQLRLLRRFQQGVILAPDNDTNMAGDKILGASEYLERFIPVFIADKVRAEDVGLAEGTDGLDLGDYYRHPFPRESLYHHLMDCIREVGFDL